MCMYLRALKFDWSITYVIHIMMFSASSSSPDFLLTCRYRGNIHISGTWLATRMADLTPDLQFGFWQIWTFMAFFRPDLSNALFKHTKWCNLYHFCMCYSRHPNTLFLSQLYGVFSRPVLLKVMLKHAKCCCFEKINNTVWEHLSGRWGL